MTERLTQEYVEKEVEKRGYKLLNTYINSKTKLILQDTEGYLYSIKWDNFNREQNPWIVHASNPYSIQNIKLYASKRGYTLLSDKYVNTHAKLILQDEEGYLYTITWNDFSKYKTPDIVNPSNPYSIQNIQHYLDLNLKGYKLISKEYKGNTNELQFMCNKGHKFTSTWAAISRGQKCGVCSGRQILKGYNDIATTDPWMIDLGMSREDAENYTKGSNDKVIVTCPHCGKEKEIKIYNIYNRKSICCSCNSDGVSYSEKFIISMLDQLNIQYVREYKSPWSNNKRYDFYSQDYNCIIECHGRQHYKYSTFSYCGGRSLKEEQENDEYKKDLALNNGIERYITLDCRESNLEYIKHSILNSELNDIFDLSSIDWLMCESEALSNKAKEVCDYWNLHNEVNNEELTTTDVGEVFNLSNVTIIRYLKQGCILGWCNYNPKESKSKVSSKNGKSHSKPVEIFKNGKSLGIFCSCYELERKSEELFGVKLFHANISAVCNEHQKTHKGYTFKYVD